MSDAGRTDIDALRVTWEESRRVLDHQISWQKDLDDKALRTVQLSLVLIALVVSVAQLVGPNVVDARETGTVLSVIVGVLLLAVAVFVGLGVYMETVIPFGVGSGHRLEVVEESYSEHEWLQVLLDEYVVWRGIARESNRLNALWLGRAQISMAIAVGYLFVSSSVLIVPITPEHAFFGASLFGGIALLLWYLLLRPRESV